MENPKWVGKMRLLEKLPKNARLAATYTTEKGTLKIYNYKTRRKWILCVELTDPPIQTVRLFENFGELFDFASSMYSDVDWAAIALDILRDYY